MQAYCNNLVDHHMILDLAPSLAHAFFSRLLKVPQSAAQAAVLVVVGLQQRELSAAQQALNLPSNQVLALFVKTMKRFYQLLKTSKEAEISRELPQVDLAAKVAAKMQPQEIGLDEELEAHAIEMKARRGTKADHSGLDAGDLMQYAIKDSTEEFEKELKGDIPASGLVQVR
jgi:N-acetyltransferase 10